MKAFGYFSAVCLCVLVGFAGCLVLMQGVQADSVDGIRTITYVKMAFAEDYMKHHGRQVKSYCIEGTTTLTLVDTVPSDKRFIITDIVSNATYLYLGDNDTTPNKFRNSQTGAFKFSLNSGIVYEPGESIYLHTHTEAYANISGYYVDMPQP